MTTLTFPETSEDWSAAFNNGLSQGRFVNDPSSPSFWGLHELQASEIEDGAVVADWFQQRHTLEYKRIPRAEKEIEK